MRVGSLLLARRDGVASGSGWRCTVVPFLVVSTAVILAVGAPLQIRWDLSRDEFDQAVARADIVGPAGLRVEQSFGLYNVHHMFVESGGVHFSLRETRGAGFAHLPDGPPAHDTQSGEYSYSHLEDDWYTWVR